MSLSFRRLRFLLGLILVCIVTAYGLSRLGYFEWPRDYDPLALPDLDAAPNLLTPFKLKLIDSNAENCQAAFARAGKTVAIEPERSDFSPMQQAGHHQAGEPFNRQAPQRGNPLRHRRPPLHVGA